MTVRLAYVLDKTRHFALLSRMVIFHFEEAGDWNQACCHSIVTRISQKEKRHFTLI